MGNIKEIIFDVDGVLIEADGEVRREKYIALFRWGLELLDSPQYSGSSWMFQQLKQRYDDGMEIAPHFYTLINPKTPEILEKLARKYKLSVCSLSCKAITLTKLKVTRIDQYFKSIHQKPFNINDSTVAVVEDRDIDYGECVFIKFNHGQHKNQSHKAGLTIVDIEELTKMAECN